MLNICEWSTGAGFPGKFAAASLLLALAVPVSGSDDGQAFIRTPDSPQIEWGPCPAFMPEGCGLAVLQGNPAEPNADALFRLPAGTSVAPHWHHSAERMVLIAGEMQVHYEGHDPEVLTPGTYAYGPPELSHSATCRSRTDCVLFIAFEAPIDALPTEAE